MFVVVVVVVIHSVIYRVFNTITLALTLVRQLVGGNSRRQATVAVGVNGCMNSSIYVYISPVFISSVSICSLVSILLLVCRVALHLSQFIKNSFILCLQRNLINIYIHTYTHTEK